MPGKAQQPSSIIGFCGTHFVVKILAFAFYMLATLSPALAGGPWSGIWKVTWPGGGAIISLEQTGQTVRGSYQNGRAKIEATAQGREIDAQFIEEGSKQVFRATMAGDQASFSGFTSAGEWLSGTLLRGDITQTDPTEPDLTTPRRSVRSFLDAGNLARAGEVQALSAVVDTIDFGNEPDWASREEKFAGAVQLFDLVDLATFSISSIPEETTSPQISLSLPRIDSDSSIEIDMRRNADGNWRLVMPPAQRLREAAGPGPVIDAFRQLQNPRDTLRSFLEGMSRWNEGGDEQAISAIDLSGFPEVLKLEQGRLSAQYLVRIIDQVGRMPLQSVPNSGISREPYVYYEHPVGRIVIEPVGTGLDTRWKFSADTVSALRQLFAAIEPHPEGHTLNAALIPSSPMFAVREQVKAYAPTLLHGVPGVGGTEYWQVLAGLLLLSAIILTSYILHLGTYTVLARPSIQRHVVNPRRLAWAIGAATALILGSQIAQQIGLPAATRQFTVPLIGSVLILISTYAGWQLIGIASSFLEDFTDRTETPVDNILLAFVRGLARLILVGAAGLGVGYLWSLPTTGVLATLGVGGLAIAFASKETLSNVFGAGILLSDRPFQKGDRIMAGDVNGWVESVGLRSTRIRTLQDSLLVVPNGKLADTTINNLGAIRRRALSSSFLVTAGSTPESLQKFKEAVLARITSDPLFDAEKTEVNITAIGPSGIQVEISTSLNTSHGADSRSATHELYIDILKIAEATGLTLGRGMEKRPVYLLQET